MGLAYSYNDNNNTASTTEIRERKHMTHNIHAKLAFKNIITEEFKINTGIEHLTKRFTQKLSSSNYSLPLSNDLNSELSAAFTEADISFSDNTALRVGLRADYSSLNKELKISPRIAFAQRISENNKITFAYGRFYQESADIYRLVNKNLRNELCDQYTVNIEHNSEGKMLKAEVYYKKYDNLVKNANNTYNNKAYGYAKGIDIFWKDSRSISNLEYRLSYSYIDSKRDALMSPILSPTTFTAKHNLSLVTKYWIGSLKSLIGCSYSYNSGRSYNNPNSEHFMNGKTKAYNDISLSWSYLISPQKILFLSVSNITGFNNVYSYSYAKAQNPQGNYDRAAVIPSMKRFIVAGLFITISNNKKLNQMKNL
jgi:outer membrane receptor for ferrienterochelin and colicin